MVPALYSTRILRLLPLNLFERRSLTDLLRPPDNQLTVSPQLLLWSHCETPLIFNTPLTAEDILPQCVLKMLGIVVILK